jgi:hypothetical protein
MRKQILWRGLIFSVVLAGFTFFESTAAATILRFCSYNIDCADQGSDNNLTNAATLSLPTVIKALGLHTSARTRSRWTCWESKN